MLNLRIGTCSAHETRRAAAAVARLLEAGDVVVLAGDLGGGKTTFVQGAAAALGCVEPVTSPTFAIVHEYDGSVPVAHVDVYRVHREQELHDIGFDELVDSDRVVFVEWGERARGLLPSDHLVVRFGPGAGPDDRLIELESVGARWTQRAGALDVALAPWAPA